MWLTLLKGFWPAIPGALFAFWLSLMLHNIDARFTKQYYERKLTEQKATVEAQCAADKKVTQEVSNDYQARLSALSSQLARARRLRDTCVAVSPSDPTRGRDATASAGEPVQPNVGVAANALLDYAAEAEQYRLQLLGCQDFVNRTMGDK